MSTQALELTFLAGLHKLDAASKTATFYIMNTSRNRNRWGVTEKALSEASPSLKGKKLGMGAGYKIDKHYPEGECMDCGVFVAYSHQGNYLEGNAKIEDPKTLGMLKNGKLGPISVVINAYAVSCSKCGVEIKAEPGAAEKHVCIQTGAGYEQVDSFTFKRVDFVAEPAYPQAGLLDLAAATQTQVVPLELLAGFYTGTSQEHPKVGVTKSKEEINLSENKEVSEKLASLEQANKKLQSDYEAIQKQASTDKAEAAKAVTAVAELKAKLEAIEKEKHDSLVADVAKARLEAGIAGKAEEEKVFLANLSNDFLAVLKVDALKVASIMTQRESVPKTKFEGSASQTDLAKAMKAQAEAYGFVEQTEMK